eukprot:6214050-Pleurochrysis_carterae.AAC.2
MQSTALFCANIRSRPSSKNSDRTCHRTATYTEAQRCPRRAATSVVATTAIVTSHIPEHAQHPERISSLGVGRWRAGRRARKFFQTPPPHLALAAISNKRKTRASARNW